MSPNLALILTLGFVFYLFRRDLHQNPNVTSALWLPVIWMVFIGSRSPTQWLHTLHFPISLGTADEGNPLDALIYFVLIVWGLWILSRRRADFGEIVRNNRALVIFLLYCFIAICWSDFPIPSFKRWIKVIGHPIMALVLFTEPDFDDAVATLIKRTAYVLVPFSILLIKYYPAIGRGYTEWGAAMNKGVALHKNSLGSDCMILGLFFLWHFLRTWRAPRDLVRRNELLLIALFATMIGWLLRKAHSATSLLALLVGGALIILVGRRWVNKQFIGTYVILGLIGFVFADAAFGILDHIVDLTGHGSTLEGRSNLWAELLALNTNPLIGVGFESFWLGDWVGQLKEGRSWVPNEAHNGYLEIYLNLGLIGLSLLIAVLAATFRKVCAALLTNLDWGRLRLGFLAAVILGNWTEAKFRGLSVVWFAFYIIALDYRKLRPELGEEYVEDDEPSRGSELTYTLERVPRQQE